MSKDRPDPRPKARRPRGLADRAGAAVMREREMIARIGAVYERWGFDPLETSALEYADALGKFLPDQDRPNEGVFALQDDDEQWLSLRYDLTAPLARFVAENYDALPKPYRRWAAGPVWRNEKPGPGRFREFWQCDADTVGAPGPAADAEMIALACAALDALGLEGRYRVKFSDRRLWDLRLDALGVPPAQRLAVLRSIDKYDRLGEAGVSQLLGAGRKDESGDFTPGAGLGAEAIEAIIALLGVSRLPETERLAAMQDLLLPNDRSSSEALAELYLELNKIHVLTASLGGQAVLDPSVVRGLEYYTATVFEAELIGVEAESENVVRYGSIGGGGRYDDLVSRFKGQPIPATGFSIGVSRLAAALEALSAKEEATGPVVVLALDQADMTESFAMAAELRAAGLRAEVYLGGSGMKAQLRYADKRASPVAVIAGEDERAKGVVTLKDLRLGAKLSKEIEDNAQWRQGRPAQIEAPRGELVAAVRRMIEAGP